MARFLLAALLSAALTGVAAAQTPEELAGTWRRTGGSETPAIGVYTLESTGGGLTGSMVNAPQGFECDLDLSAEGGKLVGSATWTEAEVSMKVATQWELTIDGPDTLSGRCQWKVWAADGTVTEEGWDQYQLERVTRVGLVVDGEDAEEPFGDPIPSPAALAGAYVTMGQVWLLEFNFTAKTYKFTPFGDHHPGAEIVLGEKRGLLLGEASLGDGNSCTVQLAWNGDGFVGRSSWVGGAGTGEEGWAELDLARATRVDEGDIQVRPFGGPPGDATDITGVYRRTFDGLYLRLSGDLSHVEGDLVDGDGQIKARVELNFQGKFWEGTGNFDGIETLWELGPGADGLTGRTQYVDHVDGKVVSTGWRGRSFTKLRKVN